MGESGWDQRGDLDDLNEQLDHRQEYRRGLYHMVCFNALGGSLQRRLVYHGNLPMGYVPIGWCHNPAEVEVTTVWDEMPGPRFYCCSCAITYLENVKENNKVTEVTIRETNYTSKTLVEIVDAKTGEVLDSDTFSGKYGTLDHQRGWWMARCDELGWTVLR